MRLIDGGLSTELTRLGAQIRGELWTGKALLENPELVEQAHRSYVAAGAEVVITSSYQLSRQGFQEIGLTAADANAALRESIRVARAAVAGTNSQVAASVGPYGAVLHDGSEYRGDYKVSQAFLEDFHAERIEVLLQEDPDLLAVETIPNLVEARALKAVLATFEIPRWIAFTAESETKLWSGENIDEAIAEVSALDNLVAIGFNCVDPRLVSDLTRLVKAHAGVQAIAYPNRGGQWDSNAGQWIGQEPRELIDWLPEWRDAGLDWVGGCCGTDSSDISKLASEI